MKIRRHRLTPQNILDAVHDGLTKQGRGSYVRTNGRVRCKLRDPKGHRCAVGLFIRDKEYSPHLDSIVGVVRDFRICSFRSGTASVRRFMVRHEMLLEDLRVAHDEACEKPRRFLPLLRTKLKKIAQEYALLPPGRKRRIVTVV